MANNLFSTLHLQNDINKLSEYKKELELEIEEKQKRDNNLQQEIIVHQNELASLEENIEFTKGRITGEELKAYVYPDKKTSSAELEDELRKVNEEITSLIIENNIIINTSNYRVDGSCHKGAEFQKFYGENLLIGFNNYFDKKAKSITVNNYEKTVQLIVSNYAKMNKRASIIGDKLNTKYLVLKLKTLKLLLNIKIAISEERSREIEERRRLREQEKLLADAEKAKAELAKERRMYEQSLARALTEAEKIEFEAKLKEIDKREADIDYRINNAHAGYLYITATEAMPNMVKLGVTRRLNPLVRIHELSSASVPFPFVCYGLVFSDDAFELETNIHEYFSKQRVNKENRHKEFFNITVQEAIDVLKNKFKCEVHFIENEPIEGGEE